MEDLELSGYLEVFPSCCGAVIFHALSLRNCVPPEQSAKVVGREYNMALAITNEDQRHMHEELCAAGFRKVFKFKGNYNNDLILWASHRTGDIEMLR